MNGFAYNRSILIQNVPIDKRNSQINAQELPISFKNNLYYKLQIAMIQLRSDRQINYLARISFKA